jgi:N-formylglutamate amidohydrolase
VDARRPELCIGTDADHTPEPLVTTVLDAAGALGFEIARDTPFAGTFVPTRWLGDARVRSVMLEIRRDTYMDESTGMLHAGAERVGELVRRVVEGVLAGG